MRNSIVGETHIYSPITFLGRQPIFNKSRDLYGNKLLVRPPFQDSSSGDREAVTRDIIHQYLAISSILEGQISFLCCTRQALTSKIVTLLPPESTVLELQDTVTSDQELTKCCEELRDRGYRFALSGVTSENTHHELLPFADFVKIDFEALDESARHAVYSIAAGNGARFIAEKVETDDAIATAADEGCELFQSSSLFSPRLVQSRSLIPNTVIYLRVLTELSQPSPDLDEIERFVSSDTSICHRLLRIVNSAAYGLGTQISSLRQALLLIGENKLRKMVAVAFLEGQEAPGYRRLNQLSLERARFCQLLGSQTGESSHKLFLVGLLSLLDKISLIPMPELVEKLPLGPDVKAALSGEKNALGFILDLVRCHETGDWRLYEEVRASLRLSNGVASRLYVEALQWASKLQ